MNLQGLELGKKSSYDTHYDPNKLFPIPRITKRLELGLKEDSPLPFYGYDLWNHYEVSWLNMKGKPIVGVAEIIYDCSTPFIIESKSMKLYFNTFNQTQIASQEKLQIRIQHDIEKRIQGPVEVKIFKLNEPSLFEHITNFNGFCIDDLDIDCAKFTVSPEILKTNPIQVKETIHSHLLKSNCLVTFQPDWGSVEISYEGNQIDHASLLQYLVSFRNHNEFHEQCIERIFLDIKKYCNPKELSVMGRYTRRGGVDINPFRTSNPNYIKTQNTRLLRQ